MSDALTDIVMPDQGEEGTESVVASWFKSPGDAVTLHEPLLEISTDKVTLEVPAPAGGELTEVLVEPGAEVRAGDVLGRIRAGAPATDSAPEPTTPATPAPEVASTSGNGASRALSPAVRRLVKEHALDVSRISGSGRGGRVTYRDVEAYLRAHEGERPAPRGPEITGGSDASSFRADA